MAERPRTTYPIPPGSPRVACKGAGCTAQIVWVVTPGGRRMPVDHATGEPHWATCVAAKDFKPNPKRAAGPPAASHTCAVPGCPVVIPTRLLMCAPHWFKVPPSVRDRVNKGYATGGPDYVPARAEAIKAAANRGAP